MQGNKLPKAAIEAAVIADAKRLTGQIGNYGLVSADINKNSPLYKGINQYQDSYDKRVEQFSKPNDLNLYSKFFSTLIEERTFFRYQFIHLISRINADPNWRSYSVGDPDLRSTNPELATIKMQEFLGKEGAALYQLALEEEMNSKEYMDAVLSASTKKYPGATWEERPIIIVGGPSASGKSFAAEAALQEASRFIPSAFASDQGNEVIFVDGGIVRETSQMRRLAIMAANNKGFTGISNLHSKSGILEDAKTRVLLHAAETKSGMVIPETFSRPHIIDKLLKYVFSLKTSKVIFTRVVGKEPTTFRKVVAFMGNRRAWKTANFNKQELTLQGKTDSESKAYGKGGFRWGVLGSRLAEKWFRRHSPKDLSMIIKNDLVLITEDPAGSNQWVLNADDKNKNVKLISQRVFEEWGKNKKILLSDFIKTNHAPPLIKTSGEFKLEITKRDLLQVTNVSDNERKLLQNIYNDLDTKVNLRDKNKVDEYIKQLQSDIFAMSAIRSTVLKRHGDAYKAITKVISGLTVLSEELEMMKKKDLNGIIDILLVKHGGDRDLCEKLLALQDDVKDIAILQESALKNKSSIFPVEKLMALEQTRREIIQLLPKEKELARALTGLVNVTQYLISRAVKQADVPVPKIKEEAITNKRKQQESRINTGHDKSRMFMQKTEVREQKARNKPQQPSPHHKRR